MWALRPGNEEPEEEEKEEEEEEEKEELPKPSPKKNFMSKILEFKFGFD